MVLTYRNENRDDGESAQHRDYARCESHDQYSQRLQLSEDPNNLCPRATSRVFLGMNNFKQNEIFTLITRINRTTMTPDEFSASAPRLNAISTTSMRFHLLE